MKGFVTHRAADQTYVYRSVPQPAKVRESAMRSLVRTFFDGSAADAATALLGLTRELSREEADALKRAIDQHLLAPLAATLVERRFPEGDQFLFVRSNGKSIEVEFVDPDAETTAVEAPREPEDVSQVSLPAMILRPEGPSMTNSSPSAIVRSRSWTATVPSGNALWRFLTSTSAISDAPPRA